MTSMTTGTESFKRMSLGDRRDHRRGTELGAPPKSRALRWPREFALGSAAVFVAALLVGSYAKFGGHEPGRELLGLRLDPARVTPRLLQPVNGKYVDRLGGGIEADAPLARLAQPAALLFPFDTSLEGNARGAFAAAGPSQSAALTVAPARAAPAPATRIATAAAATELAVLPPPRPAALARAEGPAPRMAVAQGPVAAAPVAMTSGPQATRLAPPAPVGPLVEAVEEEADLRVLGLRLPGEFVPSKRFIAGSGAYVMRTGEGLVTSGKEAVVQAAAFGDRVLNAIVP